MSDFARTNLNQFHNSALPSVFEPGLALRFGANLGLSLRLLLSFLALALHSLLVPALGHHRTLIAGAMLLLLVYVARNRSADPSEAGYLPRLSAARLLAFAGLHAAILAAAHSLAELFESGSLPAPLAVSVKLLPLLPAVLLFPPRAWARIGRRIRPELIATLIVLFTFFPDHLFNLAWPWYSRVLGPIVYHLTLPFVPGLHYVPGPDPILAGPVLDIQIIVNCSGLEGFQLFDCVFGLMALLEWNRLSKRRALACYALGLAAVLVTNVIRLVLLVLISNRIWPAFGIGDFHLHAGWVFFSIAFLVFLYLTYGWMHRSPRDPAPVC